MSRVKKLLTIGLVVVAVAAWLEWPAYDKYKEARAMRQARAFLKTGDVHDALFSVREALVLEPTNVEAMALAAGIYADVNSPEALRWRQQVAELAPTTENKLMLAAAASRFEAPPFTVATQTLAELKSIAGTNVQWHILSAQLALRRNDMTEAEAQMDAAAKLDPTNRLLQLNLAVVRLGAGGEKAAQARQQLSAMTADPEIRDNALRSLTTDCVQNHQFAEAKLFSERLLALPQANFSDRIQQLTILNALGSSDAPAWLAGVKAEASTNLTYALQTADWLLKHKPPKETRDWVSSLPQSMRQTFPLPLAVAETYGQAKDWSGLEKWLSGDRWDNEDFLRFAWLCRAEREQNARDMADIYWHRAVSAAEDNAGALATLAQVTATWGWNDEMEECLRGIVKLDPKQLWAWQALLQRRAAAGDTAALLELNSALLAHATNSLIVKNNLAALELLLNRNTNQAFQLAKEVYEASTNTPAFASTRAFALYRQNQAVEGLRVMKGLPPDELSRPDVALYYALLLSANGQQASAAPYIAAARKAQLLPEERQLLEKLRAGTQ